MTFQFFCDSLNDSQKIKAEEAFILTYTNTKNEAFTISPDSIKLFLEFVYSNYEHVNSKWNSIDSKKEKINKYEEKSYREIFKSAVSDELKTISSAGKSQTKALTKLITKLIAFLTENEYTRPEDETFLTKEHIKNALNNWESLFYKKETLILEQNRLSLKEKFNDWIVNNGLSERTAKSYSVTGINFCDKYIKQSGFTESSLYFLSSEKILLALDIFKGIPDWSKSDISGNSMYSAACKKLAEFLLYKKNNSSLPKPFLLLAGISGTGKSRFVREQAKSSGNLDENYCLTSVRPDWHEPSDLLGYISRLNGTAEYVTTDILQFMAKAWRAIVDAKLTVSEKYIDGLGKKLIVDGHKTQLDRIDPYWLCLDEMNLAPVEQYFSDYLSVIETRDWRWENEEFEYLCDPLLKPASIAQLATPDTLRRELGLEESQYDELWGLFCKHGISIPFNLIVAGTVNMDETTHGFSRKVIDRALSFDFGEFYPNNFADYFTPNTINKTFSYPIFSHVKQDDLPHSDADGKKSIAFLNAINTVLDNTPFKLAFRALNELLLSVVSMKPQDDLALQAVWDDFLMCKVLPRIEGDCDKLASNTVGMSLLNQLSALLATELSTCWEALKESENARPDFYREQINSKNPIRIACRSKAKIEWMQQRLTNSGFTSFWP